MTFPRLQELMQREVMSEKFLACWFSTYPPAAEDEIARALASRPWLPKDYLEFRMWLLADNSLYIMMANVR